MLLIFGFIFLALTQIQAFPSGPKAAGPISCTNVHFDAYINDGAGTSTSELISSGDFGYFEANGTSYITLANISVTIGGTGEAATSICYYQWTCCDLPLTDTCTFAIGDTYVLLYANFSTDAYPVFPGLIGDDGTLSTSYELFTPDQMCVTSAGNNNGTITNNTMCCTASQPALVAPISSSTCTRFSSRTTIYNNDDNFSIFATSSITYDLYDRLIVPSNVTTNLPSNYFVCYFDHTFYNEPFYCNQMGNEQYANVTMSSEADTKFLISAFYLPYAEIFGLNGVLSSRLLYRNNQLLMKEGVAYTPQNNCAYFSAPWVPQPTAKTTAAEFCCVNFS